MISWHNEQNLEHDKTISVRECVLVTRSAKSGLIAFLNVTRFSKINHKGAKGKSEITAA